MSSLEALEREEYSDVMIRTRMHFNGITWVATWEDPKDMRTWSYAEGATEAEAVAKLKEKLDAEHI